MPDNTAQGDRIQKRNSELAPDTSAIVASSRYAMRLTIQRTATLTTQTCWRFIWAHDAFGLERGPIFLGQIR